MPTCPLALHAPSPRGLSISSPSQGAAAAQPKPLAGGVQGSGKTPHGKTWSKILVPVSTSPLEVKGLHQEGRSVKKQEVVQVRWICCPEGVAISATLSGNASGVPVPSVAILGKCSFKF